MIAVPAPMYYDPEQAAVPEGADYQQWVQAHYSGGQFATPMEAQATNHVQNLYQPHQSHMQYPPESLPSGPMQSEMRNQYRFVQSQYMTSPADNQMSIAYTAGYPTNGTLASAPPVPSRITRPTPRNAL
ncbi:hypothetical protein EW026_g5261 [Hermanssonia centrifuga]|uniref:Uncharacterized protein n=1 Tax=Hermanssonia centrifuga TaxID=98765 RepID=A0A4S4KEN3_9APHY|nr:hypothetical protein EW026_g5261 [Hermanssonia centrifuga]